MTSFLIDNEDVGLSCYKCGQGKPLLFIHGSCCDHTFFLETAKMFASYYQVYLYDRRGYGNSLLKQGNDYSIHSQVMDALSILNTLSYPCDIIAHSAGNVIAMELAKRYPERIKNLILYEPVEATCNLQDKEIREYYEEISSYVHLKKYNKAIQMFLDLIGDQDERGNKASEDEIAKLGRHCLHFIKNEYEEMFRYTLEEKALSSVRTLIGVGERSLSTNRYRCALALAKKLEKDILYFPSGHNCPYVLPKEFAYLCLGILKEHEVKYVQEL